MSDAVKCDHCGTFAEAPGRSVGDRLERQYRDSFYEAPVPAGWVKLRAFTWQDPIQADTAQSNAVQGEVCSWSCAVALVANHDRLFGAASS